MAGELVAHLHPVSQAYWQNHSLEYLRYRYKLMPHDLVVDLGAYNGDFAEEIHNQHGCNVICVEPTDSITRVMNKPWCTVINKAAGTKDDIVRFGGMFYYTSQFETSDEWGFKEFPTFDVNTILNQQIALLKINIEGAEYDVLPHIIESGLQRNIDHIQVQFHLVDMDSEKKYMAIKKKLSETHQIEWRCPFVWESWYRIKTDS